MKRKSLGFTLLVSLVLVCVLSSCKGYELYITQISYLSVRAEDPKSEGQIPQNAAIVVYHSIDNDGNIEVTIKNNTNQIMIIDKTMSFFTDSKGNTYSYYDPTTKLISHSNTRGITNSSTVNLGSVAGALGVKGPVGTALNGVNVGKSNTNATTQTNASYYTDQMQIGIAPYGKAQLGHAFQEVAFCVSNFTNEYYRIDDSPGYLTPSCYITISYSIDGGNTYDRIDTRIYRNSLMVSPIRQEGMINEALRIIYEKKKNVIDEDWYTFCYGGVHGNKGTNGYRPYRWYQWNHKSIINFK